MLSPANRCMCDAGGQPQCVALLKLQCLVSVKVASCRACWWATQTVQLRACTVSNSSCSSQDSHRLLEAYLRYAPHQRFHLRLICDSGQEQAGPKPIQCESPCWQPTRLGAHAQMVYAAESLQCMLCGRHKHIAAFTTCLAMSCCGARQQQ